MWTEVVCTVITASSGIIVALLGLYIKRTDARNENRARLRQRESLLSLRMIDASLQLSVVTANALTGGHNNGNVEQAKEAAEEAASEYQNFLQEVSTQAIGK